MQGLHSTLLPQPLSPNPYLASSNSELLQWFYSSSLITVYTMCGFLKDHFKLSNQTFKLWNSTWKNGSLFKKKLLNRDPANETPLDVVRDQRVILLAIFRLMLRTTLSGRLPRFYNTLRWVFICSFLCKWFFFIFCLFTMFFIILHTIAIYAALPTSNFYMRMHE